MTGKSLPATDLSEAFGKPSRAAGLRMPAKRAAGPRKSVKAVPTEPREPDLLDPLEPPTPAPAPDEPVLVEAADKVDAATADSDSTAGSANENPGGPQDAQDDAQGLAHGQDSGQAHTRAQTTTEAPGTGPTLDAAPRPRRGRPPKTSSATRPEAGRGRLVLWTPVSIRARMQSVRLTIGTLYLDQVLDALEATYDELPDLVAKATGPTPVQGRLFERAGNTSTEAEPRVQLTIGGVLNSQLHTIDQLVESTRAPSRSALVNAALNAALPD